MVYRQTQMSNRSGCLKGGLGGCLSLLSFFFFIIVMLSSLNLPHFDFEFGATKNADYKIDMDSLTTQRIITASYSWKFVSTNLGRKKYNLTFKLLESEVTKALRLIDDIGKMSFRELGIDKSYNTLRPELQTQLVWDRIYTIVYERSFPQIRTISEGFNTVFRNEDLNSKDKVMFLVSFVQNMKYDRPGGELDLFAPIGSIAKRFGDCDTKTILLYELLERLGIDCAIMWSEKYRHAMLGVHVAATGEYKTTNGKKYYFLETTYPGWQIGDLPPESNNKRFWVIDEIDANKNTNIIQQPEFENKSERDAKPSPATR